MATSFGEAFMTLLTAEPSVAAVMPGGIWPLVLPPDADLPAVRMTGASEVPIQTTEGPSTPEHRIQLDCYADTYTGAEDLHAAIFAFLCPPAPALPLRASVSGVTIAPRTLALVRRTFEATSKLFCVSADYFVWAG
jgi:hypothetical protein